MLRRTPVSPRLVRRFDHGSWLTLSFVLTMIVASATISVLCLARVGDGCVFDAGQIGAQVFGACVGDWPTSLRPQDELLGISGYPSLPSTELGPQPAPPDWIDGGTARYTVRRAGHTLDLVVPLHRLDGAGILRAFGYGVRRQVPDWNTLVFLGILVVFMLAPRARAAQLLLVALGGLTAVTTFLWPSNSVGADFVAAPLWYAAAFLEGVWAWLFIPTLLVVVLSFPRRVWPLTQHPRLGSGVIYGLPLTATALGFLTANDTIFLVALGLGALSGVVALVVVTADTVVRVRDPVIRAQTAWLALGLAVGLLCWPLFYALAFLFPRLLPTSQHLPPGAYVALQTVMTLVFPVCLGIAITRYRLFDVDVIINRALVYGTLTLTLALVYLGSVVVLQQFLTPILGPRNDAAIVASTLTIAALMQPLRQRIQAVIDRRFYRRKYDAARTLAAFSARLRDEVELEVLTGDLLAVVEATLQPGHVSLWVRADNPRWPEQQFDPRR